MFGWSLRESPGEYRWEELETPEPGPGDVRIRVLASGLNHMDDWLTLGRPAPKRYPHVPGNDVAGVVDAVGTAVTGWEVGEEVVVNPAVVDAEALSMGIDSVLHPSLQLLGEQRDGGHAEFVVVPAHQLVRRPTGRSWAECAAYPVVATNAWRMLRRGRMEPGHRVLVVGIGGGIALASMVVAKFLGAEVHVTSRETDKLERALALGADAAHPSGTPLPAMFDLVVESVGPATWDTSFQALKPGGRLCVCGGTSGPTVELNLPRLFWRQLEIIGATIGSHTEFEYVTRLMEEGLPSLVDRTYALEDYPDALAALRRGEQMGKLILDRSIDSAR